MIYGKLPVVFLGAIAAEKHGSTNSTIAAYILSHLDEAQNLGIKEIAQRCNVGAASVSRFCKEIGLSDFAELRELMISNRMDFERQSNLDNEKDRLSDYAAHITQSVQMTEKTIDTKKLQELCDDIQNYKTVAVFGLLKAEAAALILQGDLLMLGKQVYTNISYSQQLQYISQAGKDTLIIIFSYTGSYFDYPETEHLNIQNNWPRIWMISGVDRAYPPYVKKVLHFSSLHDQAGHPWQLQFAANAIAQEYARRVR